MATGATGQLGLALPVQGELSGTWGDTVNNGITQYTNIAIAATLTLTNDGAVTLSNTTGDASASNITSTLTGAGTVTAQFAIVRVTGTLTVAKVVTAPSYSKTYTVVNAATGGIVTFKAAGQTGVSIAVGESAFVYFNGTDYVKVAGTAAVSSFSAGTTGLTPSTATTGAVTLAGTLAVANGGTGQTTASAAFNALSPVTSTGDLILGNGTNSSTRLAIGANTYVLTSNGTTASWAANPLGTVTSASVVSANGFAGTVATATTTPAITLTTSITGVLKGNGTAISAATAGTDYLAPPSGTAILKANSSGALANATAGTDYVAPGTATTFTATQTFSGTSSAQAIVLSDAAEVTTVSATAATGTIAYDITTQAVLYYTSNASANWTVNFRGSSGTSLNTLMSTGQSMTVAFLVTQGATAYYNNVVQVDGATSGVTTRWLGGAPTAGNASGIDSYRYLIIKTGSATFTVLASNTQFKA